jgi:BolA protein
MIVAGAFTGHTKIARHRIVFNALSDLMRTDIHALTLQAFSPEEL